MDGDWEKVGKEGDDKGKWEGWGDYEDGWGGYDYGYDEAPKRQ